MKLMEGTKSGRNFISEANYGGSKCHILKEHYGVYEAVVLYTIFCSVRLREKEKDFPLIVCVPACPFVNHHEQGTSYRSYPLNSRTYILTFL